jgi:predicted PurR-regulated permease PerM
VEDLIFTMNDKVNALIDWVNRFTKQDSPLAVQLDDLITDGSDYLVDWIQKNFLNQPDWIASVTTGVYNVIRTIFNVIVGFIVSVYVLMTKETFIGQLKKIIYAIFRPKYGNVVMEVIHKADDVFGGFFIGKIIDSLIIGCLCFVGMYILRMPYTVLISVIIGVTNIIPIFGPYIGAIPSAILIFLVNPVKGIYFIIFVLILQQVDGNIIGPKILGDTTGLSPFWVIFAILLFGGSFGVAGMLFGVPVFAVIYYVIKRIVEHILRIRRLPDNTTAYTKLVSVDVDSNEVIIRDKEEKKNRQKEKAKWVRKKEKEKENENE